MAGKGYADPETVAALERANRLVIETSSVRTRSISSCFSGFGAVTITGWL
jgi:hypothetical protein